jgi:hypothetical protein
MSAVGNWNGKFPELTTRGGAKQGVPAAPQIAADAVLEYCVRLTPLMLVWLKMLKASPISCRRSRSVN